MLRATTTGLRAARRLPVVGARSMGSRSNEAPLEPGFVDKYKLNEPSRFVPIALGAGVLSTLTGIYVSGNDTRGGASVVLRWKEASSSVLVAT